MEVKKKNILYVGKSQGGKTTLINDYVLDSYPVNKILFISENAVTVKKENNIIIIPLNLARQGLFKEYYTNEDIVVYESIRGKEDVTTLQSIYEHIDGKSRLVVTLNHEYEPASKQNYLYYMAKEWGNELLDMFELIYKIDGFEHTTEGKEPVVIPLKDEVLSEVTGMFYK